ncbi:GNAT family N-acetyltransferase [Rothia uropygialis]|uniref:GNAT family N-acetyltransferase n=1 Tax=Kocuria sp. 36 TaxID=1415402 RepID=UPI00101C53A1|nr:GNAT family N-acetyltransferase [Kocuria sp. 36]
MLKCRIREAAESDIPRIIAIEVDAGQAFRSVGMPEVADHRPEAGELREAIYVHHLWVAEVDGQVVGYVAADLVDANAHVAQVSVDPVHAGHRYGRQMIEFVESWGRDRGCSGTTLTTFTTVPWNLPYYARLGYQVLAGANMGPELLRISRFEAGLPGIDGSQRCAMIKAN